jgi:hypothetical protein
LFKIIAIGGAIRVSLKLQVIRTTFQVGIHCTVS